MEQIDLFFYKLRYVTYGLLIILGLLLIVFLLSFLGDDSIHANSSNTSSDYSVSDYDSSNVVTNGMFEAGAAVGNTVNKTGDAISASAESTKLAAARVGTFAAASGTLAAHGLQTGATSTVRVAASAAHTTGTSIMFMGKMTGNGLAFLIHLPVGIFGAVSHIPTLSSTIKPADSTPTPVIDAETAAVFKNTPVLIPTPPVAQPTAPQPDNTTAWPIHGQITTNFGVPELPYEAIHTGLDISDGGPSGRTPVKAFKAGHVVETIRGYSGLGNHVVVDHGGGLTSVYGHLSSIAVQTGQAVDTTTTLGLEGSTGVSTGTHLHFEIRLNGQPVNPLQYISGRP